ncbi:hypothetical protein MTR_6g088845 [Medicago truncatula]|uniref:Uncharacterized protein n=1 Tax=Medicago truncatula TaxID=3880 RepID=A0A072UC68_MEDTR|nr:hypothetical protein MTR_6g088845 [Medicago truncatula]
MHMLLDVNTEIYPMDRKEKFLLALSPSLVLNTKFLIRHIKKLEYLLPKPVLPVFGNIGQSRIFPILFVHLLRIDHSIECLLQDSTYRDVEVSGVAFLQKCLHN